VQRLHKAVEAQDAHDLTAVNRKDDDAVRAIAERKVPAVV
jgi:hypothetical protein